MYKIKLPASYIALVIAGLLLVFILGIRYRIKYTKELIAISFSGKISKFELAGKGTMHIWLNDQRDPYSISSFAVYIDTLATGDSLFKAANSRVIYYYKLDQRNYRLLDSFTIH